MVVGHLSILTGKKGEELPLNDFFLDDKMFVSIQKEKKEHTCQRPRQFWEPFAYREGQTKEQYFEQIYREAKNLLQCRIDVSLASKVKPLLLPSSYLHRNTIIIHTNTKRGKSILK